jgi:uncharacterized protein YpmS
MKKIFICIIVLLLAVGFVGCGVEKDVSSELTPREAYEEWLTNQFGITGSNYDLTKEVKSLMNDEKSFEHIKTTYQMILTDEDIEKVNAVLSPNMKEVSKYDTYLAMEFSGKNAFGGVVKQTAYAVMYYNPEGNGTISIISVK